ncbi:hypothetical protein [Paenibacillus sp. NPDC058174]|uniref:hypothetical protein n=1 Tax=Paenibacillus sp. NPDC058174 TaxID=3346366 RepID=UPI0036DCAFDD
MMKETDYYVLEYDSRISSSGGGLEWPERMLRGYEYAADEEIVYVKQGQPFASPCMMEHYPLLLLSEELSLFILKANPEISYKRVVVMNLEKQNQSFYKWMDLPKAACPAPERTLVQGGQIMAMTADIRGLEDAPVFTIPYYRAHVIIARLDAAESLLRAGIYGLVVRPIQIAEGEF